MTKLVVPVLLWLVALVSSGANAADCNGNAIDDHEDVDNGTSRDCNDNEVPDECELSAGPFFRFESIGTYTLGGGDSTEWGEIVQVADFNGDRNLDVIVGHCSAKVKLLLNEGGGSFALPVTFDTSVTSPEESNVIQEFVTVGDLNGDGAPDVVTGNRVSRLDCGGSSISDTGSISVLTNNGNGMLTVSRTLEHLSLVPRRAMLGDIDSDGDLDLIASFRGVQLVFYNRGKGEFEAPVDLMLNEGVTALGDVDGDGHIDLVSNDGGQVVVFSNTGDGEFVESARFESGFRPPRSPSTYVFGDVDGDRDVDIVATAPAVFGQVSLFINQDEGKFQPQVLARGGDAHTSRLGDVDRDGDLDILTTDIVLLNDGEAGFDIQARLWAGHTGSMATGDLDGDGDIDVVRVDGAELEILLNVPEEPKDQNRDGLLDSCSGDAFLRGDCDGDGNACSGVNDALTLLSWLFRGDTRPSCIAACDVDGNGETELTDAVYGLDYCFTGTAPPPAPFLACGVGTVEDDALGCAAPPVVCD